MSSGKLENQLLDAIQTVVDKTVEKAGYDKTIQATIVKCANEALGKYIVKYQDTLMYVYSSNPEITYTKGANVYVLIPMNNTSLNKTIIGSVKNLGADYITNTENEVSYEMVGKNCINSIEEFGLCSYNAKEEKILYSKQDNINYINLNNEDALLYLKNSNFLMCGAKFKTLLNSEQQFRGQYGITFELAFADNNTGDTIIREYTVDINKMIGNPYKLTSKTEQKEVFEIDSKNFLYINKIYIFEYDFPNIAEDRANDIFVSDILLYGANFTPVDEMSDCSLSIITPKGIYFDDTMLDTEDILLQAQLRVKGVAVATDSPAVKYFWFKENNSITYTSLKFNRYGGLGWECLNNSTVIDDNVVEWDSAGFNYYIKKTDVPGKITEYKCVAVYNDETIVTRQINIFNYSSQYDITIQSDSGNQFYFDIGEPTLTCYVNGKIEENYEYTWSAVDHQNNFISISNSNNYEINGNKLKVAIKTINDFNTFKCSVSIDGRKIGVGSIVLKNSLEGASAYSLIIDNGDQVFKYNENGISPANDSNKDPIIIFPLSFTLFDDMGNEVPHIAIRGSNIKWTIPTKNTMISILSSYGEPIEKNEDFMVYSNLYEIGFNIDTKYNVRNINNTIELEIIYKDKVLKATTDFTFLKEGLAGTNGTGFVCKIVPNITSGTFSGYPTLTYYEDTGETAINYNSFEDRWFKVQLWYEGIKIFEDLSSGFSTEEDDNNQVKIEWSILQNKYDKNNIDNSNFTIDKDTGAISFSATDFAKIEDLSDPANIIKCKVTYKNNIYYDTIPLLLSRVKNNNYEIALSENTGFTSVLYSTDGHSPMYNNTSPFTILVKQNISGEMVDISLLEDISYEWNVLGDVYISEWQSELNLIERKTTLEKNKKHYKPVDNSNGLCLSNAIYCEIYQNDLILGSIHIPIHLYLNRYGNAAMNEWDGNSISINEEDGIILSPQVGAGKKNEDNSFTGVFMGSVAEAGTDKIETGLFGYSSGERTIALDAEDGSARFGKSGSGQIVIDPSDNTAVIKSGDFVAPVLNQYGDIITPGQGLEIDLTDPHITFGTGNFRVDKNGNVFAKGYTTIIDLEKGQYNIPNSSVEGFKDLSNTVTDLEDTISYLEVFLPTNMISFSASANKTITETKTSGVNYNAAFKGQAVAATARLISTPIENIIANEPTLSGLKGEITFTVAQGQQLVDISNPFVYEFTYEIDGKTYTTTKQINVVINLQGTEGESGTSITIQEKKVLYAVSSSGTEAPESGWQETVPVVEKGQFLWSKTYVLYNDNSETTSYSVSYQGQDGDNGDDGTSAISINCGNEAQTIVCDENELVLEDTILSIPFSGYVGTTKVECSVSYSSLPSGMIEQANIPANETQDGELRILVQKNSNLNNIVSGIIVLTFLCEGNTFIKTFNWSKSIKGAQGDPGNDGEDGAPAKYCKIIPTTTVFKSTTGSKGEFFPTDIILSFEVQNTTFKEWQYFGKQFIDGVLVEDSVEDWYSVSGVPGFILGTEEEYLNSLYVLNNCILFTDIDTTIVIRCLTNDEDVYDTCTITKIYDVVDLNLEVGSRNYILKSKDERSSSTTNIVYALSNDFASTEQDTLSISFDAKKDGEEPLGLMFNIMDKGVLIALVGASIPDLTNEYTHYTVSIPAPEVSLESTQFYVIPTADNKFYIKNIKLELGTLVTDWTPAPEDLENVETITKTLITFSHYYDYYNFMNTDEDTGTYDAEKANKIVWYENYNNIQDIDGLYQWVKIVTEYADGRPNTETLPTCSAVTLKEFKESVELYYVNAIKEYYDYSSGTSQLKFDCLTKEEIGMLSRDNWTTEKPSWGTYQDEGLYSVQHLDGTIELAQFELWVKTEFIYSYGDPQYSDVNKDPDWASSYYLNGAIASLNAQLDSLAMGTRVQYGSDGIKVIGIDNETGEPTGYELVINSNGIGFNIPVLDANGNLQYDNDGKIITRYEAGWDITGQLVTDRIDASMIMAQIAHNGHLKLGGESLGDGQLSIYADGADIAYIYMDVDGLHIDTIENGTIDISRTEGIKYRNAEDQTVLETNETNLEASTTNLIASQSVTVGKYVKIIPMTTNINKGIGFVAISQGS